MSQPNHFNEKGATAEALIAKMCEDAFFADFCFQNPYYSKGKELCDVLIVLGDTAIIWQIKSLKLDVNGYFKKSDITKAVNQCRGAKRQLMMAESLTMKNVIGGTKKINVKEIKRYYLIAAIEGGLEITSSFFRADPKASVHIFTESFTRFATKHLNSVADFVRYLEDKERLLSGDKSFVMGSGEQNLLALYLQNARTFGDLEQSNVNMVFFDGEDEAEEFEKSEHYKEKLEADKWVEIWEELIRKKRAGITHNKEELDDEHAARDKFLAKMMGHTRLEMRVLGEAYFGAAMKALESPDSENFVYRRLIPHDGVTYVFAFMGDGSEKALEKRKNMLQVICFAARQVVEKNDIVIGVATELKMLESPACGFEWVLMDISSEDFEMQYGDAVRKRRKEANIWTDPEFQHYTAYEYPSDHPKYKRKRKV